MQLVEGDQIIMADVKYNLVHEVDELKNQLSISRRIGFFFGAGTSMSIGMPGIVELTKQVKESLVSGEKEDIDNVIKCLKSFPEKSDITIEDILNHIRLIRQITRETYSKGFEGINGKSAKNLDISICNKIYQLIAVKENESDITPMILFASWLNWLPRDYSKEIFTVNYDLVLEKAFEDLRIPYFDGFVGAHEPFFLPESIESKEKIDSPPFSWIRLWKLHGSFGWFWQKREKSETYKVIRLGSLAKGADTNRELVIYPSRDKYESSRKQPFTAYFDRLKSYLQEGETHFIINGYSFGEEHINDILFNSLKQNNRLHIIVFLFSDSVFERIKEQVKQFLNISVFSPSYAVIGGFIGAWDSLDYKPELELYYDKDDKKLTLGDFKLLVNFLINTSGSKFAIEDKSKRKL